MWRLHEELPAVEYKVPGRNKHSKQLDHERAAKTPEQIRRRHLHRSRDGKNCLAEENGKMGPHARGERYFGQARAIRLSWGCSELATRSQSGSLRWDNHS